MTDTRTLHVKTPADLLALVPYLFGFHPEESLVVVAGRAREPFNVRVDLPAGDAALDELSGYVAEVAARHGARLTMVVLYTRDAATAQHVFDRLNGRLVEAGVGVAEAIRTDGVRWWSLTGCAGPCCPAEGTPYDIGSHAFTALGVLEGKMTHRSRAELAASLASLGDGEPARVRVAAERAQRRLRDSGPGRRRLVEEGRWVEARIGRFLEDECFLGVAEAGRLLADVTAVDVRDVAWSLMCRENAALHVRLWRDLVRRSPRELLAPPAGLLAFAAWLAGDGALAWCAIERCQEAEPDYGMALLLTDALAAAMPPSSWRPVGRAALSLFAG